MQLEDNDMMVKEKKLSYIALIWVMDFHNQIV